MFSLAKSQQTSGSWFQSKRRLRNRNETWMRGLEATVVFGRRRFMVGGLTSGDVGRAKPCIGCGGRGVDADRVWWDIWVAQ